MSLALTEPLEAPRLGIWRTALAGLLGLVLLVGSLGGWAATTVIGGAVVAPGQIAAAGRSKEVQHPDGGTVASIAVANGDRVSAGDVLLTLDPTLVALELDIARTRLAAALALRARLEAERLGAAEIDPRLPSLPAAVRLPEEALATERTAQAGIFAARAEVLRGGRAQLVETLARLDDQIAGAEAQIAAAGAQLDLLGAEIATQQGLVGQGLSRQSELNLLLRQQAEIEGRRAELQSRAAELATAKRDARIATEQAERTFMEEVVTELRETTGRIEELVLEIATRQDELDRMVVRAPADGIVHELQVTTVGGVVRPGETLLEIVPRDGTMEFEVRVDPAAVDQIHVGQAAELVLAAFDRNALPRLQAQVRTVSAAAVVETQTGRSFYRVELEVPQAELVRIGDAELIPGMPVEAYLATGDRTVLSYLLQPVASHLRRAFRE